MPIYTIAGKQVKAPDGMTRAGAVGMMRQRGVLTAGQAEAETLAEGEAPARPETGGVVDEFLIGAGKAFADRSFGLIPNDATAPDSLAAMLGGAAPLVAASFALPGTGLAGIGSQGALAGGLEAIREGSSVGSVAGAGALGGAGTGVGAMASRVASGISRVVRGAAGGRPLLTTATSRAGQSLNRTLRGTGAFGRAEEANQLLINRAGAKALGQQADDLGESVLGQAADDIGDLFEAGIPDAAQIDVTRGRALLDQVDFAGKARVLAGRDGNALAGKQLKPLLADLRAKSSVLKRSNKGDIAEELDFAIDALQDAAETAGGDKAALKLARERWKVLKNLEEISQVVETGNIPAGQLSRRLSRESRKGFGTGFKRGRLQGVSDETQELIGVTRALASDKVPVGSPTASRALQFGPGALALGGLATGDLTPEQAAGLALTGLTPLALGPAAFGVASQTAGRIGAGIGQTGFTAGRQLDQ